MPPLSFSWKRLSFSLDVLVGVGVGATVGLGYIKVLKLVDPNAFKVDLQSATTKEELSSSILVASSSPDQQQQQLKKQQRFNAADLKKEYSVTWDEDWDGMQPKLSSTKDSADSTTMKKIAAGTRQIVLIRHGQYVSVCFFN
jgi:hypothetical protein